MRNIKGWWVGLPEKEYQGVVGYLRKQVAFCPRQKLRQAPSSLPASLPPFPVTQSVVLKREEGVEEDGKLVEELRLRDWPLHFRGFDGITARLCGFELEKLSSLSGLLCSPSFDTFILSNENKYQHIEI